MPVSLPNLDDRSFDEIVEEGKRLLTSLAPSWTDHNPSDPGITFIELFAFLTEMLLYRADRVSTANKQAFVKLLRGDPEHRFEQFIDEEVRLAILNLRSEQRAVTSGDFKRLAESLPGVGRAHSLPRRNEESPAPQNDAPAHVSLLIVPRETFQGQRPLPSEELKELIRKELTPRCLLTTRLHVAAPTYLDIAVHIVAHVFTDQNKARIENQIKDRLVAYFHPLSGGFDGRGWPFGQSVYVSDVYAVLDAVEGVDYVAPNDHLPELTSVPIGREILEDSRVIGLLLKPHELIWFDWKASTITVVRQTTVIPEE